MFYPAEIRARSGGTATHQSVPADTSGRPRLGLHGGHISVGADHLYLARIRVQQHARAGRNTMTDTAAKLAEHYRKLTAEEVAMAKVALTNEAVRGTMRRPPIFGSWRMQRRKAIQLRVKPVASVSMSGGKRVAH